MNTNNTIFREDSKNNYPQLSTERGTYPEELQKFLHRRSVSVAFNSAIRSSAPKCIPNTRLGVRQTIRQWFERAHDPPICWLRGPAGSGKSAIAQTVAEEYEESGELAASFFFEQGRAYRHYTDFVPTIAFQLSIKVPQTKVLMQRAFELDPSIPDQTPQYQFKRLIVDPLLELGETVSRKIVVVDGLNQYGERWVEDFIILLTDACQDGRLPLRFCLTSRIDVPMIMLPEAVPKGHRIFSLALEEFDVRGDIQIFFEMKFQEIHRRSHVGGITNRPDQWPSPLDIDRLVSVSSGSFMFASIIVKFVDDGRIDPYLNFQTVMTSLGSQRAATSVCSFKSFVDYLVGLLASDDISIQAAATTGLESVTIHDGADAVVSTNAIPSLVKLLESGDVFVLIGACGALVNITTKVDIALAAEVANADVIPPLIHLLSFHDARVQRSAVLGLKNIIRRGLPDTLGLKLDAIPRLIRLLPSDDISIQASATAVLENITMHGGAEISVTTNVIPSVVRLLKSGDIFILIAACRILINTTTKLDIARAQALDADAIPPLISLLSFDDLRVQRSATFAIMGITLHEPAKTAALALNIIPNIVRLLASENVSIQASAAAVLQNVTTCDAYGAEVSVQAETISSLVRLLTSSNTVVLIAACGALKNITFTFDRARAEASNTSAIPSLICLLSYDDVRVQRSATFALMHITLHGPAKTAALASDAIPNLVRLLGSDDIGIQASAAAVLENITTDDGAVDAVEANAIPSLVKLLTSNNAVVLIAACAALANITSTFGHGGFEVLNADAIRPLTGLLSFNDVRVQKSAILALKNITLHDPARTAALNADVIPNLVNLLASNDISIQALSAAALEGMTVRGGAEVAIEANAIPALLGLLLTTNVHVFIAACGALKNMMTPRCAATGLKIFKHLCQLIFLNKGNTGSELPEET